MTSEIDPSKTGFDPAVIAKNPAKIKCSHLTSTGEPCRAWAIHGSDPPICSTHAKLTGGGAPKGNNNALKHGFYSRVIRADEAASLVTLMQSNEIDDELAMTRVVLRRTLEMLNDTTDPDEFEKLAKLHYLGVRTVAGLLKASGPSSTFRDILDTVLSDLGSNWGTDL